MCFKFPFASSPLIGHHSPIPMDVAPPVLAKRAALVDLILGGYCMAATRRLRALLVTPKETGRLLRRCCNHRMMRVVGNFLAISLIADVGNWLVFVRLSIWRFLRCLSTSTLEGCYVKPAGILRRSRHAACAREVWMPQGNSALLRR